MKDYERISCGASHPDPQVEMVFQSMRDAQGFNTGASGGCGRSMVWPSAYRCVECGRFFHSQCIRRHFDMTSDDKSEVA